MKNSEMKVTELLESKNQLEGKLSRLTSVLTSIKGEAGETGYNFSAKGLAAIYADRQEYRFEMDRDLIEVAVEQKIKRVESELKPVINKLDAIELMLNS